jgi:hypothetical protein
MDFREFSLKPFPGDEYPPEMNITGSIGRRASRLSIGYTIRGGVPELAIPAPEKFPARKDRLWEGFCLEFLLGTNDSSRYWEFNLSPRSEEHTSELQSPLHISYAVFCLK